MLRSGTTSVIDHFPEQGFCIGDVETVVRAFSECGMRAVVALRIFDGEYSDILPAAEPISNDHLDETWWVALNDALQRFIFGERGGSVRTVIVDGVILVDDGLARTIDAPAIIAAAKDILNSVRKRNGAVRAVADAMALLE
jgi:cytosine/adenosine deaminase-related metal-dependent hydrolase